MKPTVVASIHHGLGNQMFQYAVARRLAYVSHGELVLWRDSREEPAEYSQWRLDQFSITGRRAADDEESWGFRHVPQWRRKLAKASSRFAPKSIAIPELREPFVWDMIDPSGIDNSLGDGKLLFQQKVVDWRGSARLSGYWQDERYFSDCADIIRRDFQLKSALDARNRETLARIQSNPSVFMHVRRGDYLLPNHIDVFGVCDPEYYARGLAAVRARTGKGLKVFVFSNDPGWVRENRIGGAEAEIIDWNAQTPECDLALMRACNHAIIANSSFSWWGAWLGEWSGQIVVAPQVWFKVLPKFRDILPDRWLRL